MYKYVQNSMHAVAYWLHQNLRGIEFQGLYPSSPLMILSTIRSLSTKVIEFLWKKFHNILYIYKMFFCNVEFTITFYKLFKKILKLGLPELAR